MSLSRAQETDDTLKGKEHRASIICSLDFRHNTETDVFANPPHSLLAVVLCTSHLVPPFGRPTSRFTSLPLSSSPPLSLSSVVPFSVPVLRNTFPYVQKPTYALPVEYTFSFSLTHLIPFTDSDPLHHSVSYMYSGSLSLPHLITLLASLRFRCSDSSASEFFRRTYILYVLHSWSRKLTFFPSSIFCLSFSASSMSTLEFAVHCMRALHIAEVPESGESQNAHVMPPLGPRRRTALPR